MTYQYNLQELLGHPNECPCTEFVDAGAAYFVYFLFVVVFPILFLHFIVDVQTLFNELYKGAHQNFLTYAEQWGFITTSR